jgi:localization factor PodJL
VAPAAGGFAGEAAAGPAGGAASHGGAGEAAAAQVDLPRAAAIGSEKLRGAAAGGDPGAAFEVAVRYAEGRGVPQDLVAAAAWYRRAAESGVAVAAYRLGSLFERGPGVSKDLAGAAAWYGRAAAEGNVGAMHNLAVLLSEGIDGVPDHARALQWFREAAAYGVKDSEYNLGVIYARGAGVSRDLGESYKWFAIAAGQGDSDAAARRDEVAAALSPEELAKARAAVAGWQPKEPVASANGITAPPGGWDGTDTDAGLNDSDRKALVKKIQSLLSEHGYDPGPADGVEGPKTEEAVRAFQHSIGVADTGTIDQGLVAALSGPTG